MPDPVLTRAVSDRDAGFLLSLFQELRGAELGWHDLSDPCLRHLLVIQHEAPERSYRTSVPACIREVICLAGEPVGTVVTAEFPGDIRLVELGVAPRYQRRGIGSSVMEKLIRRASRAGKTLSLTVQNANPALRLHQRLGFVTTSQDGVHCRLALKP